MAIKLSGALAKNIRQNHVLVPHLEKAFAEGDFDWSFNYSPKEGDTAWHPSGDCTPTMGELFHKARGTSEERVISPNLYRTFMVGHFWHQYIQFTLANKLEFCDHNAIERRGKRVWKEEDGNPVPFHWVTGSADVAPVSIPNAGDYLLDIKTMNSHDFRSLNAPAWTVDKWECQMNIYLDFFDLEDAIILGVQKDSPHDLKEFHFSRNQDLIDAIYKKWKLVGMCLEAGLEPPHEEEIELPLRGPK